MKEPSIIDRFVEWLRELICKLFGHDWVRDKSDGVVWCKRCGAEEEIIYFKLDEKGNLRKVSCPDDDEKEAVLQSNLQLELERKREQLEKFAELLTNYLQIKTVAHALAYDKGQVQAALDELFAFVGELIDGSPKWNKGTPKGNRQVLICFRHDGEYYHDTDKWCPETKEWEHHKDKQVLGWCEIPLVNPRELEQGNESD